MSHDKITQAFLSFRHALVKLVGGIVSDPVEIEDILQEAYARSFEAGKKHTIHSPKSYLARTARNLALNYIQRSAVKYNISTEEDGAPPVYSNEVPQEDSLYFDGRFRTFCRAVQSLPLQCRRVFVLKKVYGLSQKEIAMRFDISEKTVEYHVANGLVKCRKYMNAASENSLNPSAGSGKAKGYSE